jgi:hypothetical protein
MTSEVGCLRDKEIWLERGLAEDSEGRMFISLGMFMLMKGFQKMCDMLERCR